MKAFCLCCMLCISRPLIPKTSGRSSTYHADGKFFPLPTQSIRSDFVERHCHSDWSTKNPVSDKQKEGILSYSTGKVRDHSFVQWQCHSCSWNLLVWWQQLSLSLSLSLSLCFDNETDSTGLWRTFSCSSMAAVNWQKDDSWKEQHACICGKKQESVALHLYLFDTSSLLCSKIS